MADRSGAVAGFLRMLDRVVGGDATRVVAVQLARGQTPQNSTAAFDQPAAPPAQGPSWFDIQAIEAGRIERYRDYREGRVEVPEWERAVQVKKGYAFNSQVGEHGEALSYRLTYAPGARREVTDTCDATTDALDLHSVIPDIYDAGQWLGDGFDECIFDLRSRAMVDLRHWEPERVLPNVARATGRVRSYSVATGEDLPNQAIGDRVDVAPFLMVHYAPNRVRGSVYGRSMFAAGRKERREYEAANDTLVLSLAQAIANQYLLWPFPREQQPDLIWRFVNQVRSRVELDLQFNRDGVLRRRLAKMIETSPRVMPYHVDPDLKGAPTPFTAPVPDLKAILEVARWKQENTAVVGGVPLVMMGINRTVNSRATATEESAQFAVSIMGDQTGIAQDVISVIYLRALMARGIVPVPGEVRIEMFPPSQLYELARANVTKAQGEAAKVMVDAGVPLPFALKRAFSLGDDEITDVLAGFEAPRVTASAEAFQAAVLQAIESMESRHGGRPMQVTVDVASKV